MPQPESSSSGLAENIAGALCYLLGLITGLIFLLIDKRRWVRFHAAQSVVVFGGLFLIRIALIYMSPLIGYGLVGALGLVIGVVTLVLWVVLMIKAYQHQTLRVPIASDIADGIAGK